MNTSGFSKIILGAVFLAFAAFMAIKGEYLYATILVFGLIAVVRIDQLADFLINLKDGTLGIKFNLPEEKIKENIEENNEPVNRKSLIHFQEIESKILALQQKKYGGDLKTLVHFIYGSPDKPEFMYTPDGSLKTNEAIYFFEIKYVLKPEFAKSIVEKAMRNLKTVYDKLFPSAGKKIVIKLILASGYDIDIKQFNAPKGIELEFVKI